MPRSTEENINGNNLFCCDFLLSLFCTSLVSYRRASICDPLPVIFISEKTNEKKFEEVEMCVKGFLDLHYLSTHPRILSLSLFLFPLSPPLIHSLKEQTSDIIIMCSKEVTMCDKCFDLFMFRRDSQIAPQVFDVTRLDYQSGIRWNFCDLHQYHRGLIQIHTHCTLFDFSALCLHCFVTCSVQTETCNYQTNSSTSRTKLYFRNHVQRVSWFLSTVLLSQTTVWDHLR
jgi:hypothetical protein